MSLKADKYNYQGKKTGQVDLPKEIFGLKLKPDLIAQAVRVYLTNQIQAQPKTKSRGQVIGSRRKIWAQKGTGRARHGDRYAPIFVGGGIAHGPKGRSPKRLKMSKKMKRQALFSALSEKQKNKQIIVLNQVDKLKAKTKKAQALFEKILKKRLKKPLLISYNQKQTFKRAIRNLSFLKTVSAHSLNTYLILNHDYLIITQQALDEIKNLFIKKQ